MTSLWIRRWLSEQDSGLIRSGFSVYLLRGAAQQDSCRPRGKFIIPVKRFRCFAHVVCCRDERNIM